MISVESGGGKGEKVKTKEKRKDIPI